MPTVGGKKYSYTKSGKRAAAKARKMMKSKGMEKAAERMLSGKRSR